jgi:glycosyltransferase-like protein
VRGPSVALVTYSTRPRGGVVHATRLAEALHRLGERVHLFALGGPGDSFASPPRVPHTILPAPARRETLTERVFAAADALEHGLRDAACDFDLVHAQDCIAARAALGLRRAIPATVVVRTVHHVDTFTTAALVECQHRSIVEPDHVLVVSDFWRHLLADTYGVDTTVVTNGVDACRFARRTSDRSGFLRRAAGASDRFLFLTVGGIEPRKGSAHLVEACALLRRDHDAAPALVVVGGHSFQDHGPYRDAVLRRAAELGLRLGTDIHVVGTVSEEDLVAWYHAADAFVLPSVNEGWGLSVLEALAARCPVIATSIPVFEEYLTNDSNALLVAPGDGWALARAMGRAMEDRELRERLACAGPPTAARYTWDASARRHAALYRTMIGARETTS